MKIKIGSGWFDYDVIAFVRKLKVNSAVVSESAYVVQLKKGYSLDGKGAVNSIFLNFFEGEEVMRQIEAIEGRRRHVPHPKSTSTGDDEPTETINP